MRSAQGRYKGGSGGIILSGRLRALMWHTKWRWRSDASLSRYVAAGFCGRMGLHDVCGCTRDFSIKAKFLFLHVFPDHKILSIGIVILRSPKVYGGIASGHCLGSEMTKILNSNSKIIMKQLASYGPPSVNTDPL